MMQIEHNFLRTYTETFTYTVGATERTGVRYSYFPKPSAAAGAFVAPNGSDTTGTGTELLPFRTVGKANTILGGGKNTIWLFRNGSLDPMTFTETAGITFAGSSFAVEDGQIATLDYTSLTSGAAITLGLSTQINMNGLHIKTTGAGVLVVTNGSTASKNFHNCTFENLGKVTVSGRTYAVTIAGSTGDWDVTNFTFRYCSFKAPRAFAITTNGQLSVYNSIFNGEMSFDASYTLSYGIHVFGTSGNKNKIFERNIFCNFFNDNLTDNLKLVTPIGFQIGGSFNVVNPGPSITLESNHFVNTNSVMIWSDYNPAAKTFDYAAITCDNNHFGGNTILQFTGSVGPSDFVITNTDEIDGDTPALFHDEIAAIQTDDIEFFRLQRTGQTTPDGAGKFFMDSPLIEAGLGSVDLNPFEESIALNTEGYNDTLDINWPPGAMTIENMFANPANLRDVNGNLHIDYDKERRKFVFNFTDQTHLSNLQMKGLRYLLSDRGSKRFYPLGIAGNLFKENGSSQGTYSDTDDSFAPDDAVVMPMVVDWWRGFWINIAGEQFYIESNDETKMYLIDKESLGFPANGNYTFIVDSILINIEANSFNIKQNNFTQFTKGGFWRETSDDIRNYDYTISTVTFEEIEDNEENI